MSTEENGNIFRNLEENNSHIDLTSAIVKEECTSEGTMPKLSAEENSNFLRLELKLQKRENVDDDDNDEFTEESASSPEPNDATSGQETTPMREDSPAVVPSKSYKTVVGNGMKRGRGRPRKDSYANFPNYKPKSVEEKLAGKSLNEITRRLLGSPESSTPPSAKRPRGRPPLHSSSYSSYRRSMLKRTMMLRAARGEFSYSVGTPEVQREGEVDYEDPWLMWGFQKIPAEQGSQFVSACPEFAHSLAVYYEVVNACREARGVVNVQSVITGLGRSWVTFTARFRFVEILISNPKWCAERMLSYFNTNDGGNCSNLSQSLQSYLENAMFEELSDEGLMRWMDMRMFSLHNPTKAVFIPWSRCWGMRKKIFNENGEETQAIADLEDRYQKLANGIPGKYTVWPSKDEINQAEDMVISCGLLVSEASSYVSSTVPDGDPVESVFTENKERDDHDYGQATEQIGSGGEASGNELIAPNSGNPAAAAENRSLTIRSAPRGRQMGQNNSGIVSSSRARSYSGTFKLEGLRLVELMTEVQQMGLAFSALAGGGEWLIENPETSAQISLREVTNGRQIAVSLRNGPSDSAFPGVVWSKFQWSQFLWALKGICMTYLGSNV